MYGSTKHVQDHAVLLYQLVEHCFEFVKEDGQLFCHIGRMLVMCDNTGI